MSGAPIFEQLCRDHVEAAKAWPEDVTEPPVAGGVDGPACSAAGDVLVYELDDHLPLVLAELACPAD
ncbi:MAG: hypothetical protein ACRDSF_10560 [Pseudonocardiaceae bacterium]